MPGMKSLEPTDWKELLPRFTTKINNEFPAHVYLLKLEIIESQIIISGVIVSENSRTQILRFVKALLSELPDNTKWSVVDRIVNIWPNVEASGVGVALGNVGQVGSEGDGAWKDYFRYIESTRFSDSSIRGFGSHQNSPLHSRDFFIPSVSYPRTSAGQKISSRGANSAGEIPKLDETLPQSELVSRYPAMESSGTVTAGNSLKISIDLVSTQTFGNEAIELGEFPAGWNKIEISVQLSSPWFREILPSSRILVVHADGTPQPVQFLCELADELPEDGEVPFSAAFFHGCRICGYANWTLRGGPNSARIEGGKTGAENAKAPASSLLAGSAAMRPLAESAGSTPLVTIVPNAPGPTLTIMIKENGGGRLGWTWLGTVGNSRVVGSGDIDLGANADSFAHGLINGCPGFSKDDFRSRMRGVGTAIWMASPLTFRNAYASYAKKIGANFPIQFASDDPYVPWEMMLPQVDGMTLDHLFLQHPVARWPLSQSGAMRSTLPTGNIFSFVPEYSDGDTLPTAKTESDWIVATLNAKQMEATRAGFLTLIGGTSNEMVSIIHFAGHGRADSGQRDGGIRMTDGWVYVDDVNQGGVTIGERDGTFLVLNACEASSQETLLGTNAGWGAAIAARGFGGMMAPLWAVQDRLALPMIQSFLPGFVVEREALGEALRKARLSHADHSVASFAYLAHGDVMSRLV